MSGRHFDPNLPIHADNTMRLLIGDVEAARKALSEAPVVRPRRDRRVHHAQRIHRSPQPTGRVVQSARAGFTRYSRSDAAPTLQNINPMAVLTAADAQTRRAGHRTAPQVSLVQRLGQRYMYREYLKRAANMNEALSCLNEFKLRVRENQANMHIDRDHDGRPDMARLNRAFTYNVRDLRFV